jgi:Holliday junction resolvase RusA-like endonuclease
VDVDAGEKAAIDAVFHYLTLNDNLVVDKHTTKEVDREDPRVEVELRCVLQK